MGSISGDRRVDLAIRPDLVQKQSQQNKILKFYNLLTQNTTIILSQHFLFRLFETLSNITNALIYIWLTQLV
jgi:hypothetical protein